MVKPNHFPARRWTEFSLNFREFSNENEQARSDFTENSFPCVIIRVIMKSNLLNCLKLLLLFVTFCLLNTQPDL